MSRTSVGASPFAWVALVTLSACALPHATLPSDAARDRISLDASPLDAADRDANPDRDATSDREDASPRCPDGGSRCAEGCTDTETDPRNCGACGVTCSVPRAVAECRAGRCVIARCEPGFEDCDRDRANGCETPLDTVNDCGACGATCSIPSATPACVAGRCALGACLPGFADCDANLANGCETPLGTERNCTRCSEACAGATPVCDTTRRACTNGCVAGATVCGGACVNTMSDAAHCGGCGRRCPTNNATPECVTGMCRIRDCASGFADCDRTVTNGCEVDVRSSVMNCGACGRACSFANASARCAGGVCAIAACNPGFADCDGDPGNGCEVDTRSTLAHCGGCRARCAPDNAAARCLGGVCGYSACAPGFLDCDGNAGNGCEVDGRVSDANCGACNARCTRPNASAMCSASACQLGACNPGFGDCDRNPMNGCEAAFASSTSHCGSCGNACPLAANATATCMGGTCSLTCAANFENCDRNAINGCEADLRTVSHCGACGRACSFPLATAACTAGSCTIGSCNAGFGDCDAVLSNGCETPLGTPTNCRRCGVVCRADEVCGPSGCECPAPLAACSSRCVDLQVDRSNCGRCGNACPPSAMCVAGSCQCASGTLCSPRGGPAVCCPSDCTPMGTCM